jgi:hypothetical protein
MCSHSEHRLQAHYGRLVITYGVTGGSINVSMEQMSCLAAIGSKVQLACVFFPIAFEV